MAQLGLFGDDRRLLVDDATGSIAYFPAYVPAATATAWFAQLRDETAWRSERRRMYDRDVDVPRLVASYRLDDPQAPGALRLAAAKASEAAGGVAFTTAGLNLYRDGRDSVAPHNDHLYEIAAGFPIVLISLGATRRMTIRSKAQPRRIFDVDLEHGSVLVMSYETQKNYDHGIPKAGEPVEPRMSLAFRVRPSA
jgi:alkylated DNA repair dioxygenase AlkB